MNIINLTPHRIVVLCENDDGPITGFTGVGSAAKGGKFSLVDGYNPEGKVARAVQKDTLVGELEINGYKVPVITTTFGAPSDLPGHQRGVYYIVSVITARAAKAAGRTTSDLLVTSYPVRDGYGKVIGVRKFAAI